MHRKHSVLVVHPNEARLEGLMLALGNGNFEPVPATSADDAVTVLRYRSVDAVVAQAPANANDFLDELDQHSPRSARVLLVEPGARASALSAIGEGHRFSTLDDGSETSAVLTRVRELLQPRALPRLLFSADVVAEFAVHGSALRQRARVLDVSNFGIAVAVPASGSLHDFMPGARITGLTVRRGDAAVIEGAEAVVRHIRPVGATAALQGGEAFRVGLELLLPAAPEVSSHVERDPLRVVGLIREALRTRSLRLHAEHPQASIACEGEVDLELGALALRTPRLPALQPWDVARFSFALHGKNHEFLAAIREVSAAEPAGWRLTAVLPRALNVQRRRTATRFLPGEGQAMELEFALPFRDVVIRRPVSDVTTRGASVIVAATEVAMPLGTCLRGATLHLGNGHAVTLDARVRSLVTVEGSGELRCGLEFAPLPLAEGLRIADAIVHFGFPGIHDARGATFSDIWTFLKETDFLYPEKLERLKSVLPEVQRTLTKLIENPVPQLKIMLFRSGDQLQGHQSAVQIFRNTWMVQHLAGRKEGKGRLAAARMLNLSVFHYLEQTPDMEWVRTCYRPNNKFPVRVVGNFIRRLPDPTLYNSRTYTYMVAPARAAEPGEVGDEISVRPARADDFAAIEKYFVSAGRTVELQSSDLTRDTITMEGVRAAYQKIGLERRREVLIAERDGVRLGFALLEISSFGLNFSELTNAFTVHVIEPDADALWSLAAAARARYAELGRESCIAMADAAQVPELKLLGFTGTKEYTCVTFHRTLVRRYFEHVVRLFDGGRNARSNRSK